jgi:hypothetical protein
MAVLLAVCRNAGAIWWVPAVISTTYWVPVLTFIIPNRKVSWLLMFGALMTQISNSGRNHVRQQSSAVNFGRQMMFAAARRFAMLTPSFLTLGECSAQA